MSKQDMYLRKRKSRTSLSSNLLKISQKETVCDLTVFQEEDVVEDSVCEKHLAIRHIPIQWKEKQLRFKECSEEAIEEGRFKMKRIVRPTLGVKEYIESQIQQIQSDKRRFQSADNLLEEWEVKQNSRSGSENSLKKQVKFKMGTVFVERRSVKP